MVRDESLDVGLDLGPDAMGLELGVEEDDLVWHRQDVSDSVNEGSWGAPNDLCRHVSGT